VTSILSHLGDKAILVNLNKNVFFYFTNLVKTKFKDTAAFFIKTHKVDVKLSYASLGVNKTAVIKGARFYAGGGGRWYSVNFLVGCVNRSLKPFSNFTPKCAIFSKTFQF